VIRDANNVIPVSMAVLLHVILLGSMVVAFDFARTVPITPLAIRATLVTEIPETLAPQIIEPEPEPVVEEPEPVVEEPEPEPDNTEELRRAAEEEKRRLDALVEKERLEKIRQQDHRGHPLHQPVIEAGTAHARYGSYHIHTPASRMSTADRPKTMRAPRMPPSMVSPIPKSAMRCLTPATLW